MATPHLTHLDFWQDPSVHMALPPHLPGTPDGLAAAATPHLPEGGCLFLTSGTEGPPKWVVLEKRAFLHSARVVNAHYDLTSQDHWLIALPQHHVGGFSIWARATLCGAPVTVFPDRWQPTLFAQCVAEHLITATSLVPTQLHDLVTAGLTPPPSLRLVLVGGGTLAPDLFLRSLDLGWPVCATYGMTETASSVASQPLDHDRRTTPEVLEILPHWQVSLDPTSGCARIHGPALAKGYLTPNSATWDWLPINAELGLLTRDRIALQPEGTRCFLRFLGRHSRFVKITGEWVALDTLQHALQTSLPPALTPILHLLALPDPRREHRLVLAVESPSPAQASALDAALQQHHATAPPHQHIDHWRAFAAFPRTDLGKIQTKTLQQLCSAL